MINKFVPEMAGDAYWTNACHMTGRTPSSMIRWRTFSLS